MVDGRDLSTCRLFTGYLPGYRSCTTQVELDAPHHRLWVHLASVSRFSVALDPPAIDVLAAALAGGQVCAVPCQHESGRVLLGAHPDVGPGVVPYAERYFDARPEASPMRIYLHLDETDTNRIEITFTPSVTEALVDHLRTCRDDMVE